MFDAVKIALTATPALHTVEIFGRPVFVYSYREAVVDGYLVDHEPPIRIHTQLSSEGIRWQAGEQVTSIDPRAGQIDLFTTPDELRFDVAAFTSWCSPKPSTGWCARRWRMSWIRFHPTKPSSFP